ncbi:MAG TPA: MlaD family protein [Verrucomicrobiae bacterium]|nr:MlaD family protein [Verrucomicrobiae bacterium]
MKNTLETRLGIFVALAVIAAVLIVETVGGESFRRGYHLNAEFSNIQDLKVGDRVKIAGVEVGRVEKISLDETNNKVRVNMKLRKDVIVRTDSIATVKFTGLMGQNFVGIDFGTPGAPPAVDGSFLTTAEQPDFSAMMQKIDSVATGVQNLTKSFTGEKIDNLLGPFTDFLKANREPLTKTIQNFEAISSQVRSGQGSVGKLIYDNALYNTALTTVSNLQDTAEQAKMTLADAREVMDNAKRGQGTIGKLLTDDKLYNEATATMSNARQILEKVNHGEGSVGKLVNDQEFYRNAKLTLQKLDKATEGLEDQGPLSVLGIAINNLF